MAPIKPKIELEPVILNKAVTVKQEPSPVVLNVDLDGQKAAAAGSGKTTTTKKKKMTLKRKLEEREMYCETLTKRFKYELAKRREIEERILVLQRSQLQTEQNFEYSEKKRLDVESTLRLSESQREQAIQKATRAESMRKVAEEDNKKKEAELRCLQVTSRCDKRREEKKEADVKHKIMNLEGDVKHFMSRVEYWKAETAKECGRADGALSRAEDMLHLAETWRKRAEEEAVRTRDRIRLEEQFDRAKMDFKKSLRRPHSSPNAGTGGNPRHPRRYPP